MHKWLRDADVVVTTALIPGRPAPKLITAEMLLSMKAGSVVLDMAASASGGNCATSRVNEVVTTDNGVKVIGYTNLPARLPSTASALFSMAVALASPHL
jgi:NAD(P) transhydrogenase subunit alpha